MNTSSPPVKPEVFRDSSFDVRNFKNLLNTLRKSKAQQEDKAKPVYDFEE